MSTPYAYVSAASEACLAGSVVGFRVYGYTWLTAHTPCKPVINFP